MNCVNGRSSNKVKLLSCEPTGTVLSSKILRCSKSMGSVSSSTGSDLSKYNLKTKGSLKNWKLLQLSVYVTLRILTQRIEQDTHKTAIDTATASTRSSQYQ